MSYLRGLDRSQVQLLPPCVDDYVESNSPARFIDSYVESLDLEELGFARTQPAQTGRPPYHPGILLRLYLYGYLYRIRSSRRLEAEAGRNLELIWLLRGLRPDFKTIADFRKDNRAAFKPLFRHFNLLCRKLDLFGAELVAIDGSKFKAVNSPERHYTKEQLQELLGKIDQRIDDYLHRLEEQDEQTEGVPAKPSRQDLEQKIAQLQQRQQTYEELVREMAQAGQSEVALTDPDSRGMKKVGVGYNVQVAVDAKHHLIVEQEVVQAANDYGQLSPMATAAKEALAVEHLQVVADAGYHEAQQLEACEAAQITTFVPARGTTSGQTAQGQKIYPKEAFSYQPQTDSYQCPAGQSLARGYQGENKGKLWLYYYNPSACAACPLRSACTTGGYRKISRLANEEVIERQAQRLREQPTIVPRRKELVEHVFGTLREWGHDRFLLQGLEKVRAEFSLSSLSYNLRRVLNVLGVGALLEAIEAQVA